MNKTDNKRLFKAIEDGDVVTIDSILSKNPGEIDVLGCDNSLYRDKTPLMYAMQCGRFDLARTFLDLGADVRARMGGGGPKTGVLALAMIFGHPRSPDYEHFLEFSRELIRRGAEPSEALMSALASYSKSDDRSEMIEMLLENGASLDHRRADGMSVREIVAATSRRYSARILQLCGVES
jgi:ankyrin repeat protein